MLNTVRKKNLEREDSRWAIEIQSGVISHGCKVLVMDSEETCFLLLSSYFSFSCFDILYRGGNVGESTHSSNLDVGFIHMTFHARQSELASCNSLHHLLACHVTHMTPLFFSPHRPASA